MELAPADHAYDHCLAVLRDPVLARAAAHAALDRAGRGLAAVLGEAREESLLRAERVPVPPADARAGNLVELAWMLAAHQPAIERAVVDLDARHGLGRAGLGRALGLLPTTAAAWAAEVGDRWERELGPALLAALGPGDCEGLRQVLVGDGLGTPGEVAGDHDPTTAPVALGEIRMAAPAVAAHLEQCAACTDRRRSMASVRSLLAQVPAVEAPPEIRLAGSRRGRRPVAPALAAARIRGRARAAIGVTAAVLVVAAGVAAAVLATRNGGENRDIATLTRIPAENALAAIPGVVQPGQVVVLENRSGESVRWEARGTERWIAADPDGGRLPPGSEVQVLVTVGPDAPEGELRASLVFTADDGSTAGVVLAGTVERPPTVGGSRTACTVTASAEDETEVTSVELHWSAPSGERSIPMVRIGATWTATLSSGPDAATAWWVAAVDSRGNLGRSDTNLLVQPCG